MCVKMFLWQEIFEGTLKFLKLEVLPATITLIFITKSSLSGALSNSYLASSQLKKKHLVKLKDYFSPASTKKMNILGFNSIEECLDYSAQSCFFNNFCFTLGKKRLKCIDISRPTNTK